MQTIYQPGLASENCYWVPASMIGTAAVVGIVLMVLLARFMPRSSPHFRTMTVALIAVPVMVVGVAGQRVLSGAESIVRIATDGSYLEYTYCSRLALQTERHPLTSLTASHYRREVDQQRNGVDRVYHRLDLQFWGRPAPITITLDASPNDVNLDLAERIAPAAVQKFRAAEGR